jgi:hypothetical protein
MVDIPMDAAGEALVDVLREDNGKALRELLKACSTRDDPESKRLAEMLATHPALRDLVPQ